MQQYMKFAKGTLDAFQKLASKDPNTVYFVVDLKTNKSTIYIGDSPIVDEKTLLGFNLSDLNDINTENLKDGQVLTYDQKTKSWKGEEPLIQAIIASTAPTAQDFEKYTTNLENQILKLEKDLKLQEENIKSLFITAAKVNQKTSNLSSIIEQKIKTFNETADNVKKLIADFKQAYITMNEVKQYTYSSKEIDEKIKLNQHSSQHLSRKIFSDLEEALIFIKANIEEAEQYIYLIPSGLLEDDNKYYEYLYFGMDEINEPIFRQIGSWEVELSDYINKKEFENLQSIVQSLLDDYVSKKDLQNLEQQIPMTQWSSLEGE